MDPASDSQSVKLSAAICSEHEESTSVANAMGCAPASRQSDDSEVFQDIMPSLAGENESSPSSNTPERSGFPGMYPGFPERRGFGATFYVICSVNFDHLTYFKWHLFT